MTDATHTPAEIAKRWRVSADKVRHWIRSGELAAVDVSGTGSRRPRWRISEEAIAAFARRRSAVAPPPPRPRPRRAVSDRDYVSEHFGGAAAE